MKFLSAVLITFVFIAVPIVKAAEKDLYDFLWLDPDKSVYVLQNKLFKKKGSFYIETGYTSALDSKFQSSHGVIARVGWYFAEEWAIELAYNKYTNSDNDTHKNVQKVNGSIPFIRRLNQSYGAIGIWSPFYGKINTFNKIFYFDWSFGIGIAQINTESNLNSVNNAHSNSYTGEDYMGCLMKTALKFYATEKLTLGLEFMRTNYKAKSPIEGSSESWKKNSDLALTIGYSF